MSWYIFIFALLLSCFHTSVWASFTKYPHTVDKSFYQCTAASANCASLVQILIPSLVCATSKGSGRNLSAIKLKSELLGFAHFLFLHFAICVWHWLLRTWLSQQCWSFETRCGAVIIRLVQYYSATVEKSSTMSLDQISANLLLTKPKFFFQVLGRR